MIEQILRWLESGWDLLAPVVQVNAYEKVVILRRGAYQRTLEAGWHMKWPLMEYPIMVVSCMTTMRLPPQTLTTKDDKNVVVAVVVRYEINDPKPYVTDVWDQRDVLADVTLGAVGREVRTTDWATLCANPPEEQVIKSVRAQCNRYGFKIHAITFTDLGRVNSLRLIQPGPANLDN